ncbi:MAG: amidophosphoribosyltransferase [Acidobacteriota bacterium]
MCGIFGVFDHPEAARLTVYGLYGLQHRGQESAGVATSDGTALHAVKGMGLVSEVFGGSDLSALPGRLAIGHVRYSTSGSSHLRNAGPIVARTQHGEVALSHNGNLVNGPGLREDLEREGAIFASTTDSEVILHLFARAGQEDPLDALVESLRVLKGAFSLLLLFPDRLVAVRDPWGFRPLVLGDLEGSPVFASETPALDLLKARFIRELHPGEVVVADRTGLRSLFPFPTVPEVPCIFEYVYFARPDSELFGRVVYPVRVELGRRLAEECPARADVVVPVPDSGVPAAVGFAERSGLPLVQALIRNHYVGRTFIAPRQSLRDFSARLKLNAVPGLLAGKRVVLVDDSLVRGTTSRKIVQLVRDAGAGEVHLRLSSPPIVNPCVYGIDTPEREELLAANMEVEAIRQFVGADSIGYLGVQGLHAAAGRAVGSACHACFGGPYPVAWKPPRASQRHLFEKDRRD